MLKSIINLYFLFAFGILFAQETTKGSISSPEKLPAKKIHFAPLNLRIGFDIGNFIYGKTEDLKRINFSVDSNLYKNYFLSLHLGSEEYLFNNQLINMNTSGNYWMLGLDYNLYGNWPGMDNQITIGFHYGHASFSNHLQSYIINQNQSPFPQQIIEINKSFDHLKADWFEIQSGIQVELFKNFYLGYNISIKYLLSKKKYAEFELTHIPGYRKVNSTSPYGFGMQYFISYRFKTKKASK